MIVIIPVHEGDRDLCIKNLEHALWLEGGKVDFHAVVHHESGFEAGEVLKAAQAYFASVVTSTYPKWTGNKAFPHVQNNAWKRAAQWIELEGKDCWLWFEADCVPLRAGWLADLDRVYKEGGRPFAGAVVHYSGNHYLAGVSIFPPNPSELMLQAMLASNMPFDVAAGMKDHVLDKTHDLSDLIHHVPDVPSTHFENLEDVQRKIKPTALLFHKVKTDCLRDILQGKNSSAENAPLFTKSVFDQRPNWRSGLFAFPYEPFVCRFNPSIVERDGKRFLLTRKQDRTNPNAFQSTLEVWEIRPNFTLKYPPIIPDIPRLKPDIAEQFEDPRAIITQGGKCLMYLAHWSHKKKFPCRQLMLQLSEDFTKAELSIHPKFGGNDPNPELSTRAEKNWFFIPEKHAPIKTCYQINPMTWFTPSSRFENPKIELPWSWGEPRGGTNAVDVGDHWLSFFHSSKRWNNRQNQYAMGAVAFEKKEPHRLTHITREPILIGSAEDFRIPSNPPVAFPGSCIFDGREFLISMGLNDQDCAYFFIPSEDLAKLLEPI